MNDFSSGIPDLQIPSLPLEEARAATSADPISAAKAWKEAEQLSKNKAPEELQAEAAELEHGRNQIFRNHFERLAIASLYVSSIAVAAVGGVWLWHMAMPQRWRWLPISDVQHLQSIMTAGLLVGVVGNHFKKRLA